MIMPNQTILVIEDSQEDFTALERAFRKAGLANPIRWFHDGEEALDYLHRRAPFENPSDSPKPGIILLDLNMPGTDGREVLSEIKEDSNLKKIPVVVLTTSSHEQDVDHCYKAGANSYLCKPVDFQGLIEAIQRLSDYWFSIVVLPKESGENG